MLGYPLRGLLALAVACMLLLPLGHPPAAKAATNRQQRDRDRAVLSYQALQRYFYLPATKLYRETYPPDESTPFAYLWPFSQAMAGTLDLAGLPELGTDYQRDGQDRLLGLGSYWGQDAPLPRYDSSV